ncbi:MAG: T9SS C-terminal target domain-containing protein [Ignavibacteria bacterium]|nr:MAG: T9SS C-terminal target domain-containing protein [Ignavibacteria bacterium]
MIKMKTIIISTVILLSSISLFAQDVQFQWENNVWLPGRGMETVVVDDSILFHLGGRLPYGALYDEYRSASYLEIKFPGRFWALQNTKLKYRDYVNAHYYNGKIFVMGGDGWPVSDSTVEIIDVNSLEVTCGENFPDPRAQAGSVFYDGKIYIFGGSEYDYNTATLTYKPSLYIYDCDNNSWSQGSDFPFAGVIYRAVEHNGMIYVFGGFDGSTSDLIYVYNIATDTWMQKGTTPSQVSSQSMVVYNDDIFIIGDYAEENRLWKYNITSEEWTSYSSNMIGRRHASSVIMNDRLYVIGGVAQNDGEYRYSNIVQSADITQLLTSIEKEEYGANSFMLEQNYPNPFNPTTKISFVLNKKAKVKLEIFDALGRNIKTLLDKEISAGNHSLNFDATSLASGTYFYQLNIDNKWVQSKKMLLLK